MTIYVDWINRQVFSTLSEARKYYMDEDESNGFNEYLDNNYSGLDLYRMTEQDKEDAYQDYLFNYIDLEKIEIE